MKLGAFKNQKEPRCFERLDFFEINVEKISNFR